MICPLLLHLLLPACIFACVSTQSSPQKRKCVFKVTPKNYNKYATEGNVSELVQYCKSTQCCVAYGAVVNGQPMFDVLGEKGKVLIYTRGSSARVSLLRRRIHASLPVCFLCLCHRMTFGIFCTFAACDNKVEKHCPDSACKAARRFDGLGIMCACNADLCNGNITWTIESDEPELSLGLLNSGGMSKGTRCNSVSKIVS